MQKLGGLHPLRTLGLASLILVAAMALAGCQIPGPFVVAPAAPEEVVLTIGTIPEFTTLDPNNLQSIESPVHKAIYDALVLIDPGTLEPVPWLAESWEFAPDATSLTLKLRPGVKFHNGRELTADDVIQNLNRALDEATGLSIYGSFGMVERGEAIDDYNLVFHFTQPTPGFMSRLFTWHIIAPESFDTAANNPIGTGPYRFVEWIPGEQMVVERFDGHWYEGQANIDRIVYKFFSDPETLVIAADAGQLDMVQYAQAKDAERLQQAGFELAGVGDGPTLVVFDYLILWLNPNRVALENADVRAAIARAVDRDTVANGLLFGVSTATTLPVPRQSPAWDAELSAEWDYDLEEARQLVEQSGVDDVAFTVVTTSAFPELQQTAQLIQADLASIGITMNIESVDGNTHSDRCVRGDYEACTWFASAGVVDPADFEDNSAYRISTGILFDGSMPEDYVAAFREASGILDPDERAAAFKEVWRTLRRHTWAIPIAWRPLVYANLTSVQNVTYDPLGRIWFQDLRKVD